MIKVLSLKLIIPLASQSRRGMSSRMSNGSFDKMSQSRYSNYSGSQMSGSRDDDA